MSIYFNEHGSAIGYQVDGRWTIKGIICRLSMALTFQAAYTRLMITK